MKRSKAYCVTCSEETILIINQKKTYGMYHCRVCGDEVCRVGDLLVKSNLKTVPNVYSNLTDKQEDLNKIDKSNYYKALSLPDVLSDEHTLWPKSDDENSYERDLKVKEILNRCESLTNKQKQVIIAIDKYKTQEKAAIELGLSQPVIAKTLKAIKKKLSVVGYI